MIYSDQPITSEKEDKLGRKRIANILADTICGIDNHETYTIGLSGEWGCGKTSVVNMAVKSLERKKSNQIKVIRFEAWNCSSVDMLLNQFFKVLVNELASDSDKKIVKVGKLISDYAETIDKISPVENAGIIARTISSLASPILFKNTLMLNATDMQTQKRAITNALQNASKRFLIVIDDLDRLTNEQIRAVFQLVNEVANFPNITYLLIYDMDVVLAALSKVQKGDGETYLEKIIQMPISIPVANEDKLNQLLLSRVLSVIQKYNGDYDNKRFEALARWVFYVSGKNIRDINRLCNTLEYKMVQLHGQVDSFDLALLSAIELKYNKIYSWIKENKRLFVEGKSISRDPSKEAFAKENHDYYKSVVANMYDDKKIEEDEILEMLSVLFPAFGNIIFSSINSEDDPYYIHINAVCADTRFDRYFQLDTENVVVDKKDVSELLRTDNRANFEAIITNYYQKHVLTDFIREVRAEMPQITPERANEIFDWLINYKRHYDICSRNFSILNAVDLALRQLLREMSGEERKKALIEAINHATYESIDTCIKFCDTIHEGLDDNSISSHSVAMSREYLDQVYKSLLERTMKILDENCIYDINEYEYVQRLLVRKGKEDFLNNHIISYVEEVPYYALCFYTSMIIYWRGSDSEFEITQDLQEKVDDYAESVMSEIQTCLTQKNFFRLKELDQKKITALWIYLNQPEEDRDVHISESGKVAPLLAKWEKEKK